MCIRDRTSAVPVVVLTGLAARVDQEDGPATVTAPSGEFFIEQNRLVVEGPVVARSASGYSLDGNAIEVDINQNRVSSENPVSGTLPMEMCIRDRRRTRRPDRLQAALHRVVR